MDKDQVDQYILAKPGASSGYPFGAAVKVYKVAGKMYATLSESDSPARINLKCDPAEAEALRDIFSSILPGYHMNKRHWNTVLLDGEVPDGQLTLMIDNSYQLVYQSLTSKQRESIG